MKKKDIIELAFDYHRIVLLVVGVLVVIGLYGLYVMPKQEFPTFVVRQGAVIAVYPGATSAQVESRVTKPLERFIFSYQEVNKKQTYSMSQDGMAIAVIELNDNVRDKDAFWAKFKQGLSQFKAQLPREVVTLQAKDDIGETSSILLALDSNQKTYRELQGYLDNLEDRLRRVDDVSKLQQYGVQKEQIGIYLDYDKMSQYGIGASTVLSRLTTQGFVTESGSIDNSSFKAPIHVSSPFSNERDLAEQMVYSDTKGNVVRLKDIASIRKEYPERAGYIKNNGRKCVLLSMEMRDGSNIVKMGKEVKTVVDHFRQTLPKDVRLTYITDQSKVVSNSVNNFLRELLIAVCSVIIIIVLFMPLRVASVSAFSIPITIFSALALFYIFGIELNTVTFAALIVTLGMVVDDSVVIIDNYMEKRGGGMAIRDATLAAPKEFFKSVLSATLAISITFFPFLFTMHGMQGDFVESFPWAISIILGISLLVSLLLVPYLQSRLIRKELPLPKTDKRRTPLNLLQEGYEKLLRKCFSHPRITLFVGFSLILLGVLFFSLLPQRLMPIADRNQFAVEIYLPKGSPIERTAEVADSVERMLRLDKRVVSVTSFIGQSSPRFHATYAPKLGGDNYAQLIVNTTGNKETVGVLDDDADRYAEYFTNARVLFKQLDYSDATYPVEFRLSGDSLSALFQAADTVTKYMRRDCDLKLVRTNFEGQLPGIFVRTNDDEMERLGISHTWLSSCLAVRFSQGIPLTTLWEQDYPVNVFLKSDKNGNRSVEQLRNAYIPVMGGTTSVPLHQIARVEPDQTCDAIVRRNGIRTLSIVADPIRGGNADKIAINLQKVLKNVHLPKGVELSTGGMLEKDMDTLPMVIKGLIVSILIIFFILLFHFKKISLALMNLFMLTLCVFGVSVGMGLMKREVTLTSVLGMVSLMGILVRNGIIMIDYAEELRLKKKMSAKAAAFHAGLRRLRPIFLTSAAASVGVLPMIFENSSLWGPMGTVIFFGTLISMVLISTMLPVVYWLVFNKSENKE